MKLSEVAKALQDGKSLDEAPLNKGWTVSLITTDVPEVRGFKYTSNKNPQQWYEFVVQNSHQTTSDGRLTSSADLARAGKFVVQVSIYPKEVGRAYPNIGRIVDGVFQSYPMPKG
jgi:hypothetical protein